MDPVNEETMFQPCHMILYMNLNKGIHDLSIKNDLIIRDPLIAKPKFKRKDKFVADWDEEEANILRILRNT